MMTTPLFDRPKATTYSVPTTGDQRGRVEEFVSRGVTAVAQPNVLTLDLTGGYLEAGALHKLVVRLSDEIRGGRLGQYALVVATRDAPTIDVLRALAMRHDLPLFIAPHPNALDAAEPATELTPARAAIFHAVSSAGVATVASIAKSVGVGHTSVSNTLSALADEGLLFRREGSGRRGHEYWHPNAAIPAGAAVARPPVANLPLPRPLVEDVTAAANEAGRSAAELLADAWREWQLTHRDELAAQYNRVAGLVRSGNRDGLRDAVSGRARLKAERAARREG